MRRVLFINHQCYLDRALRDVINLFEVEKQYVNRKVASELIAVVVLQWADMPWILSMGAGVSQSGEMDGQPLSVFCQDSISVSGVWQLLTISESELLAATPRKEVLSDLLNILESRRFFRNRPIVFPVFQDRETKVLMAEYLASLRVAYPELFDPVTVVLNGEEHSWSIA